MQIMEKYVIETRYRDQFTNITTNLTIRRGREKVDGRRLLGGHIIKSIMSLIIRTNLF